MSEVFPPWSARTTEIPSVPQDILSALLDLAPDAQVVVDAAGAITHVNAQLAILFGYRQDELVGHPVEFLLPESRRAMHEVHRSHFIQAARPRPMGIGLDLVGHRKDGSEFPVDVSLRPLLRGEALHVLGAVRDMTAQRQAEREQLQIAERLWQREKLISMAHDAILVRDSRSHILSWNEGAEHLYGWTAQEAMGQDN